MVDNISLLYIPLRNLENTIIRGYPVYKCENSSVTNLTFMFKN